MHRVFVNDDAVPEDEFRDIQNLLDDNNINYRERPRLIGSVYRFGARKAGCDLIVETREEYVRARELIDVYQASRIEDSRTAYHARRKENRLRELVGWLLVLLVVGAVLWLSLRIGFAK